MRNTTIICFLFLLTNDYSFCQKSNVSVIYDKVIDHPFFYTSDSMYNPLTYVFKDEQGKLHYDNVPDSNKYLIESNCRINNDSTKRMRFAKAFFRNDSLIILIDEGSPSEYFGFELSMNKKNGNHATLVYSTPFLGDANISLLSASVYLNIASPQKGDLLKGQILFSAKCKKNCSTRWYQGMGYFKCIVQ